MHLRKQALHNTCESCNLYFETDDVMYYSGADWIILYDVTVFGDNTTVIISVLILFLLKMNNLFLLYDFC